MPLLTIRATPGAIPLTDRVELTSLLTVAACRAESVPDDREHRLRCVILWQELAAAYFGGEPADTLVRAVFVTFNAPEGVLDPVRRDTFSADLHAAVTAVADPADPRRLTTSVVFEDVGHGLWGRDGAIRWLPELAAGAGFEHLQPIAKPGPSRS